ncbi:uncharacterized protein LOC124894630 [Capsicum annuum]|uniref:uncharacterized protein LOC124894630 n=1 Tax=Capsicum annuum TaxID=4072 RepID=UPI001FB1A104|nr:uncharacterized protein LOC124894630 [Capsicum annuum]
MTLDELVGNLRTYEIEIYRTKEQESPEKILALKASDSDEEFELDKDQVAFITKNFSKFFKKKKGTGQTVKTWPTDFLRPKGTKPVLEKVKENKRHWYLDSASSKYMTGDKKKFLSLSKTNGGGVSFGDRKKRVITGVGRIGLSDSKALEDVYLEEGLKHNLLSISQLYDKEINCCFSTLSLYSPSLLYLLSKTKPFPTTSHLTDLCHCSASLHSSPNSNRPVSPSTKQLQLPPSLLLKQLPPSLSLSSLSSSPPTNCCSSRLHNRSSSSPTPFWQTPISTSLFRVVSRVKRVNNSVRESVMRLFTYPWNEWWDIPIVSKQAMFQEFKTMCCWLAKYDQTISTIFERHAAMSHKIAHL